MKRASSTQSTATGSASLVKANSYEPKNKKVKRCHSPEGSNTERQYARNLDLLRWLPSDCLAKLTSGLSLKSTYSLLASCKGIRGKLLDNACFRMFWCLKYARECALSFSDNWLSLLASSSKGAEQAELRFRLPYVSRGYRLFATGSFLHSPQDWRTVKELKWLSISNRFGMPSPHEKLLYAVNKILKVAMRGDGREYLWSDLHYMPWVDKLYGMLTSESWEEEEEGTETERERERDEGTERSRSLRGLLLLLEEASCYAMLLQRSLNFAYGAAALPRTLPSCRVEKFHTPEAGKHWLTRFLFTHEHPENKNDVSVRLDVAFQDVLSECSEVRSTSPNNNNSSAFAVASDEGFVMSSQEAGRSNLLQISKSKGGRVDPRAVRKSADTYELLRSYAQLQSETECLYYCRNSCIALMDFEQLYDLGKPN